NNTTWTQQQRLVHPDPGLTTGGGSSDYFGNSVSISGNYIIVGTPNDNEDANQAGAAYIFTRSNTSWSSPEQIVASDAAASDQFGNSVAIDGDYAIVGAYGDDDAGSNSGSAYVYEIGLPVIISTSMANDNSTVTVTFSEAVYSTDGGSGALDVSDFALSLSGGWATLT
ncbi:MAG: FG-GAP repeat protein, partial [Candidatus Marinimicrobia bacterium]|nr:FG-GAP repeat protein [Candidatus Neomarinimicrobiota bacterium]